jgi:ppGpp synthetase/RelA/SpoT-type nucleotidyltranferase
VEAYIFIRVPIKNPEESRKYKEKGFLAKCHPYGYRSVHYVVEAKSTPQTTLVEIQVRTIFEEAWSEI